LTGLAGKMTIKIEAGKHYYEFAYTLAHAPEQAAGRLRRGVSKHL
jgi:hypothetical protein